MLLKSHFQNTLHLGICSGGRWMMAICVFCIICYYVEQFYPHVKVHGLIDSFEECGSPEDNLKN